MQMAMATMNTSQLSKMLALAAHPESPEQEALTALRKINKMLSDNGRSLAEIVLNPMPQMPASLLQTPVAKWIGQIKELHKVVEEKDHEIIGLQREVKTLKKKLASTSVKDDTPEAKAEPAPTPKPEAKPEAKAEPEKPAPKKGKQNPDGSYTFSSFRNAVVEHTGKDSGWQSHFCHGSGYKLSSIQSWRMRNSVPAEAFDKIASINMEKVPVSTRQSWSDKELARLASLLKKAEHSPEQIAVLLTQEFGRHISHNSIKGQTDRLRKARKV